MTSGSIDLNADVGEGFDDEPLFALVTSVNVACGAHAGDAATMRRSVERARDHGVALGAHPGYDDPETMGRRAMSLSPYAVERLVVEQVRMLERIAAAAGVRVHHVKPHGALYNQAAADAALARAVAAAVAAVDPALTLVGLAGGEMIAAGRACGLAVAAEGFADRGYRADGTLIPRNEQGALLDDPAAAAAQAVTLATRVDTICLHGDSPDAAARAHAVRIALDDAGFAVRAL